MEQEFIEFPKMARLSREVIVTEKIDGSNAQICITDDGQILAGSRNRWITPQSDNFGFAGWVERNKEELLQLGPGRHYGEWWGNGIQRRYGMKEKKFSLFNTQRWCRHDEEPVIISSPNSSMIKYQERLPKCCDLVPVLYKGVFDTNKIEEVLEDLRINGSKAAPGFSDPEGVIVYHIAAGIGFKKTIK